MSKRKKLTGNISEIKTAMLNAKSVAEFRRLQCVYLGEAMPDMTAKDIGETTLYSETNVKKIHSDFRKTGMESIREKRGGRYRENISYEEEKEFLSQFEERSASGKLIEISRIKSAYEKQLGRMVHKTVIYRMLARHGFRKLVPYKRHPKGNPEEQEAFKKTSKTR